MNNKIANLILFILLFFFSNAPLFSNEIPEYQIIYSDETKLELIGKQLLVFEDETKKLSIEDIQEPEIQKRFKLYTNKIFTHRATSSSFWIKATIENRTQNETWIEFGSNSIWLLDYYKKDTGNYKLAVSTGSLRPYKNKAYPSNLFWLPLGKEAMRQTVYIRIQTERPMAIPIQIGSTFSLNQNKVILDSTMAGFISSMLILFLYNLFLFFSTKDKEYGWYLCYVLSVLYSAMFLNHYSFFEHFLNEKTSQYLHTHPLFWLNLLFVFSGIFTIQFLNLKEREISKKIIYFFLAYYLIFATSFEVFEVIPHYLQSQINQILTLIYLILLIGIGFHNWIIIGNKKARFYCLGWIWLLVSLVCYYALINGVVEYSYTARSLNLFGLIMESLMFSFALGDKFNIMRKESEEIHKENLRIIKEHNEILELTINERTRELQTDIKKWEIIEGKLSEFKLALDEHSIVAIFDIKGKFTYVNEKFCLKTNYEQTDLIDKSYKILSPNFQRKNSHNEILKSLINGKVWKGEAKANTKFEKSIWIDLTIVPFMGLEGAPLQSMCIGTDITDFKEAEKSLFIVSEKFRETFEKAAIGICHCDLSGKFIYSNSKMCEILGYSLEELLERTFRDVTHPDDLEKNLGLYKKALLGEIESYSIEKRYIRKDQSSVWVNLNATYVKNKDGTLQYIVAVAENISKRKQIEQELLKAKFDAESANRTKTEFLTNMSHELRTPLNGIIGFTDLLMKSNLNESQVNYLEIISGSANSLLNLVNEILNFSKIESGKLELILKPNNVSQLIEQIVESLKFKANEKNLKILTHLSKSVPTSIYIDQLRLRQILINLIGNAIKFTEKGKVEIRVDLIESVENKSAKLLFSIQDTGIGISKENQEKIFEAFTQADSSVARKYGGTGLGLTISNQLLGLMNSKLSLESELGKGSKFYFELSVKIALDENAIIESKDDFYEKTNSLRSNSNSILEISDELIHFDFSLFKSRFSMEDNILAEILETAKKTFATCLEELKINLEGKNLTTIYSIAHKLKGTSLTTCCNSLAKISTDLESVNEFDIKKISELFQSIENEIEIVNVLISNQISELIGN